MYVIQYNGKEYFTIEKIQERVKPCLFVYNADKNEYIKVASFNNDEAVHQFVSKLNEFLHVIRI